jgi:palmitoyltransferase
MVLTLQDRLRMPWCGGAKQITGEIVAPIVILVLCHLFAALNMYCTIFVFTLMPVALIVARNRAVAAMARTKFFVFWLVWSVAYLLVVFEFMVPLLELLPEENLIFILLLLVTGFCFVKVGV